MPTQNRVEGAGGLLAPRALLRSHMAPSRALGVLATLLLLLAAGAAAKPAKRSAQGPNWTEGKCRADTASMWKMQQPGSKAGAPPAAAAALPTRRPLSATGCRCRHPTQCTTR